VRTVAYVEGRCTNAGLELALACDHRLAVARPETLIGCNPLERGWLPCWGVPHRLPRLIGLRPALSMLLGGQLLSARAARAIGLVDHAFGPRPAKAELNWFLADLQDRPRNPRTFRGTDGWLRRQWEQTRWGRMGVFDPHRQKMSGDPLALNLLAVVERGLKFGPVEGARAERAAFTRSPLFGRERERFESTRFWERQLAQWHTVSLPERIAVVGLSEKGIELASQALRSGCRLTMWDSDPERRQRGERRLGQALARGALDGWWNIFEAAQKRKELVVSADGHGIEEAGLIFLTCPAEEQRRFLLQTECFVPPESVIISTEQAEGWRVEPKHADRCLHCRLGPDGIQLFAAPDVADAARAKLGRWLDHCGLQMREVPAQARREKVTVFAA
jgi:enoyl-CoA hydratase/carnithine racemase